jgi:hypothetical protein
MQPLISQSRLFKYSITFQETTEESREVSDFSDSGFIIENETDEIGDILKLAQQTYGIYYPISFGGWESTTPEHNAKYFEKGIETYYALFIKNEDGTDITEEEYDFITFLLSDGNYNKSEFTDYAVGGVVLGALALGVGGLIAYYYFNKRKKGYPTGRAWSKEHYNHNKNGDNELEPSKRKVPARNRQYENGGGVDKIWEILYLDKGVQKSIKVEGYSSIIETNNWKKQNPNKEFIQIRLYGDKVNDYENGGGVDDYDYEDIGQFSMPDSEWKKYSQEDFNKIGRKIVSERFYGDLATAYDTIVRNKKYFVVSGKEGKVVSKGFNTDEEAKVEMYSMFERTGDFSYATRTFDNGGDVREMDWYKGFKKTRPFEMVVVTKEAEKDGGNEIIFNVIVEAQNDTLAYQEARKKWQMENGLSDLYIVKVYTKDEYVNSKKMNNGGGVDDKGFNVVVKLPKGLITKKDFDGFSKQEIIDWCEERGWKYNENGEKLGGRVLNNYEFYLKPIMTYNKTLPKNKFDNGGTTTTRPTTTPEVVPDTDTKPRKPKTPFQPKHIPKPKARKYDFILIKK